MDSGSRYTGKTNAVHRPKKGERLKAKTITDMQDSIADIQRGNSPFGNPQIELVKLSADLSFGNRVDAVIQGYDAVDEKYEDLAAHTKRSVLNPYSGVTFSSGLVIPVVRVGGAVVPVSVPSSSALLGITRTGGIAARTTTARPHTFPSATVDILDEVTGDFYSPNRTETVYNSTKIAIQESSVIQIKKIGTRYFVDVDDCS